MPVHIRDMKSLPKAIKEEFEKHSHWVLSKTTNKFSTIPFDQAHEQENKVVKGSGGAIGLTENPIAFRRWILSGPELARLVKQFEEEYLPDDNPEIPKNWTMSRVLQHRKPSSDRLTASQKPSYKWAIPSWTIFQIW